MVIPVGQILLYHTEKVVKYYFTSVYHDHIISLILTITLSTHTPCRWCSTRSTGTTRLYRTPPGPPSPTLSPGSISPASRWILLIRLVKLSPVTKVKLLREFFVIFLGNSLLVLVAWKIYGARIRNKFMTVSGIFLIKPALKMR